MFLIEPFFYNAVSSLQPPFPPSPMRNLGEDRPNTSLAESQFSQRPPLRSLGGDTVIQQPHFVRHRQGADPSLDQGARCRERGEGMQGGAGGEFRGCGQGEWGRNAEGVHTATRSSLTWLLSCPLLYHRKRHPAQIWQADRVVLRIIAGQVKQRALLREDQSGSPPVRLQCNAAPPHPR